MSEHGHQELPPPEHLDAGKLGNLPLVCAGVAVVGAIVTIVGAFMNPVQFAYSWLFAFLFFFTICAGCLFWVLVHHATDAEWSTVVRRQMENVSILMGGLAVLFIPLIFCRLTLFKWMSIARGIDPVLDAKRAYLNPTFFWFRAGVYFVLLIGVAYFMRRSSTRQDADGHPRHTLLMRKLAFFGIPAFALSLTFSAFDWLMGLDYHWFSTMWGVYIFAGAAGSSMATMVLIITALRKAGYLLKVVTLEHYHIMGKFLLTFTIFWAYIGFSQYMLIWYANIPEETSYFMRRNIESWNILSTILVIGRFFLPLPLLLIQKVKKTVPVLSGICCWILLMQFLDLYIIVMPMLHQAGVAFHVLDFTSPLTMAGVLGVLFLRRLPKTSLFPTRDPRLMQSVNLTN